MKSEDLAKIMEQTKAMRNKGITAFVTKYCIGKNGETIALTSEISKYPMKPKPKKEEK